MTTPNTPESFFETALEILEASGFTKLTAVSVCGRMGVTRGSFYHHFAGFDNFVDRLLAYWEDQYTTGPTESVNRLTDEVAQRERQLFLAETLPHGAEAAIRAWSLIDDRVAIVQKRVDEFRVSSTAEYLSRHGLGAKDAQIFADIAVACLVGLQMIGRPAGATRVRRALAEIHGQIDKRRGPLGHRPDPHGAYRLDIQDTHP